MIPLRIFLCFAALTWAPLAFAQTWTTAWNASPQPVWPETFILPAGVPGPLAGTTVVQRVRLATDGEGLRIVLSNRYGRSPVRIAGVTMSDRKPVTFAGKTAVILPAGGERTSDVVSGRVKSDEILELSLRFDEEPHIGSFHWDARSTLQVLDANGEGVETATVGLFLTRVLVGRAAACDALLAVGDSITDGNGVPVDTHERWTDHLAARTGGHAVINAGVSGARLLDDGMGEDGLTRLRQEIEVHPHLSTVVLSLGTNDIAWPGSPFAPDAAPMTLERLQAGYRAFAEEARARGLQVIGVTLPPFRDALPGTPMAATYFTEAKERLRQSMNAWLRASHPFDRLVDLDLVLRDPKAWSRLREDLDSGDHLHPGPAGNRAIADAFFAERLFSTTCP